jgi:glutathione S-transferase
MKLYYSTTSPYARKVRMVIHEKGFHQPSSRHHVEEVLCDPWKAPAELLQANPLSRVPTLITAEGEGLYDSPVICAYLDSLDHTNCLIPESGMNHWRVLRWEALADGITDNAYNIVMERRKEGNLQSSQWLSHWQAEINRALPWIEQEIDRLGEPPTLAHLALAAALGYLQFRLHDRFDLKTFTAIDRWLQNFGQQRCYIATRPE